LGERAWRVGAGKRERGRGEPRLASCQRHRAVHPEGVRAGRSRCYGSEAGWWGFEHYPHNVDRVEYTPITDRKSAWPRCSAGDLDLLTDPPFSTLDRIRGTPCLKLAEGKDLRTVWLWCDQSRTELRSSDVKGKNPFKDKRVRRAIYQAIDIEGDSQGRHAGSGAAWRACWSDLVQSVTRPSPIRGYPTTRCCQMATRGGRFAEEFR
jgi:hypothetical protein